MKQRGGRYPVLPKRKRTEPEPEMEYSRVTGRHLPLLYDYSARRNRMCLGIKYGVEVRGYKNSGGSRI